MVLDARLDAPIGQSKQMKPSIYQITAEYPGLLWIMPKPSGEWLWDDVQHYRSMGADLVISMLDRAEVAEFNLQNEGSMCSDNNMDFLNFPVPDRGLPDRGPFRELIGVVRARLEQSEGVAVHCRVGIGRSGMLVCSVLAGYVGSAHNAVEIVSKARGTKVPDTAEQRAFIESMVLELDGRAEAL